MCNIRRIINYTGTETIAGKCKLSLCCDWKITGSSHMVCNIQLAVFTARVLANFTKITAVMFPPIDVHSRLVNTY